MSGFLVIISTQTPEQRDAGPDAESELARWETDAGGLRWIDQLVPQGKAKQLLFAGYPLRFTAAAQDVLPLIASGPPPYEGLLRQRGNVMTKEGWNGPATMDQAKMAGCPPEQILTIDAWDQD